MRAVAADEPFRQLAMSAQINRCSADQRLVVFFPVPLHKKVCKECESVYD